jgi:hypothetical protein
MQLELGWMATLVTGSAAWRLVVSLNAGSWRAGVDAVDMNEVLFKYVEAGDLERSVYEPSRCVLGLREALWGVAGALT